MQYDKTKPEDLDTNLEDHAVDTLRYLCMAKPIVFTIPKPPETIEENIRKQFAVQTYINNIKKQNLLLTRKKL
jgi:hypothetical protein